MLNLKTWPLNKQITEIAVQRLKNKLHNDFDEFSFSICKGGDSCQEDRHIHTSHNKQPKKEKLNVNQSIRLPCHRANCPCLTHHLADPNYYCRSHQVYIYPEKKWNYCITKYCER